MDFLNNFEQTDIVLVGLTSLTILFLGFVAFLNNRQSITNKTFLIFTVLAVFYVVSNYFFYSFTNEDTILLWSRLVIFFVIWYSFFLFQFFYVFPNEKVTFSKKYKYILIPVTGAISIISLTPVVFSGVMVPAEPGQIPIPEINWGAIFFAGITVYLTFGGIFLLFKKFFRSEGITRTQLLFIFVGTAITYSLYIIFSLIFTVVLGDTSFIPFAPVFVLPFIILTFYSVVKHHLLNIKVIATEALILALVLIALFEVFVAEGIASALFRIVVLALVTILGGLLIRGVRREISLREELEKANERQRSLIHFISHQVKGFLTKSRNIFAGLIEGDYGNLPDETKYVSEEGFKSATMAVDTVQNILNASNFKKGTMEFKKERMDFKDTVVEISKDQKEIAENKGLKFNLDIDSSDDFFIEGDKEKIKHVAMNLIDNAVKYTPEGEVSVKLVKGNGKIVFSVKDSGVGITEDDKKRLFTEGGRGKNSVKVNVNSTGFGLFIVKGIVEAHGGKVWAESEGENKGSTFVVELPSLSS